MAQANGKKYDDDKRNQLFLHILQHSNIKNKDWSDFIPFLSKVGMKCHLSSFCRCTYRYYNTHILSKKSNLLHLMNSTNLKFSPNKLSMLTTTTTAIIANLTIKATVVNPTTMTSPIVTIMSRSVTLLQ